MSTSSDTKIPEHVALSISEMTFAYPSSTNLLKVSKWSVQTGEKVFLHGNSGSGKSTLLNLLCGIARPSSGQITINGTDLSTLSSTQLDQMRAKHIGIVFQQFNLIPYLTVIQNIELATYFAKNKLKVTDKITRMLSSLNLHADILTARVSSLSVGQKQRVAIMRALVNEPALLLVDEPTSALDADARDGFMQMLLSVCDEHGSAMIFVSHDRALRDHFDSHVAIQDVCTWSDAQEAPSC